MKPLVSQYTLEILSCWPEAALSGTDTYLLSGLLTSLLAALFPVLYLSPHRALFMTLACDLS
jgi:hypothetical protein